jgi:ribose transport system permease protein
MKTTLRAWRNPTAVVSAGGPAASSTTRWLERLALPIAWLTLVIVFWIAMPTTFPTMGNISAILGSQAIVLLLSLSLLVPLIAGDYDLSVAYNMGLGAMVLSVLNVHHHWPLIPAMIVVLGCGVVLGCVNAAMTIIFGIDSLIVTLGTGTFASGITAWISGSAVVTGVDYRLVEAVAAHRFLGIPLQFWYGVIACILLWYVLSRTPLGSRLLFAGRNRTVARLSGIRVGRIRTGSFIAAGLISSVAGIVLAGNLDGADPSAGPTYLLPAFAAAFLGATTITPGRFNPWGCFVAIYFLGTGIGGLQLLGLDSWIQPIFYGGALVIAVAFSQVVRGRQALETGGNN